MKFIRKNWVFLSTAILFVLVITAYAYNHIKIEVFIGLLGVIASLYFGILKYKMENDKMFQELFTSFNERYNDDFNNLMNSLKKKPNKVLKKTGDKNLIIDYFNLCAEEFLWYRKNRIPKEVWDAWKAGIIENLEIKQVLEVYISETKSKRGKKSYYGLVEELDIKINDK